MMVLQSLVLCFNSLINLQMIYPYKIENQMLLIDDEPNEDLTNAKQCWFFGESFNTLKLL